jgi:hypothetical protein
MVPGTGVCKVSRIRKTEVYALVLYSNGRKQANWYQRIYQVQLYRKVPGTSTVLYCHRRLSYYYTVRYSYKNKHVVEYQVLLRTRGHIDYY